MDMPTRKTVSLFLFIPEQHVVVLGVRATTQSHPGLLQATCHGAMQANETHLDAVERELREETGLELPDIGPVVFLGELTAGHKVKEDCGYYLASITEDHAHKLRPTAEVGRFHRITKESLHDIIRWSEAEINHVDTTVHHVMFDDEREALEEVFAVLEEHHWNPTGAG